MGKEKKERQINSGKRHAAVGQGGLYGRTPKAAAIQGLHSAASTQFIRTFHPPRLISTRSP